VHETNHNARLAIREMLCVIETNCLTNPTCVKKTTRGPLDGQVEKCVHMIHIGYCIRALVDVDVDLEFDVY
jgi:hypothetical protein